MSVKRSLSGGMAFLILTVMVCKENPSGPGGLTDAEAVAADKSALTITYMPGDSAGWVTRNVGLPDSGANGSSISWATDDSTRIGVKGLVCRPPTGSGDTAVTLTATFSKGTVVDEKVFALTVKEIAGAGTIADIDGNVYHTVVIGNQVWTVENLRTTRYNDGTPILLDTASASWGQGTLGKYCYYWNTANADTIRRFGALYNWHAVNTGHLAPAGWHVPDTTEWNELETYLIANGYNWDGTTTGNKIARSLAAATDWQFYSILGTVGRDLVQNNRSGFTGLPAGSRYLTDFEENVGYDAYWWSTTEYDSSDACYRYLWGNSLGFNSGHDYKTSGFSVRLLRD